jgi:hypothetical protein
MPPRGKRIFSKFRKSLKVRGFDMNYFEKCTEVFDPGQGGVVSLEPRRASKQ